MRFYLFLIFTIITFSGAAQVSVSLEERKTFFPKWEELKNEKIEWYYLIVPENYSEPKGKKIKIAVSVIPSSANINDRREPVVFIQGGPGGSTLGSLWRWLGHPVRAKHDIILLDLRGTGFSEPNMCPDLGNQFLQILAKNQSEDKDEWEKVKVSRDCKQSLIDSGIDIESYNSSSVSKDLHHLKKSLNISKWNVYGVSYGTFLAQEYAKKFQGDINSLILDSSIPNIGNYYNSINNNYLTSLNKVFKACKDDPRCNDKFKEIDSVYYSVIENLEREPITVKVNKDIVGSGKFTYNAEDFKIAIHQALYTPELVEIIPLLINQFKARNKEVLGKLVETFSAALSLDYGTYFCFTCNDVIPKNSLEIFDSNAEELSSFNGGLSFYRSDFLVCKDWDKFTESSTANNGNTSFSNKSNNYPVLIFSGEFDPITPTNFAKETQRKYSKSILVTAKGYGHAPSFSTKGNDAIRKFLSGKEPSDYNFEQENEAFVTDVILNDGVYSLSRNLNNFQWLFFSPMFVGLFLLLTFLVYGRKNKNFKIRILNILILTAILVGITGFLILILGIYTTSKENYYLLAFGLPTNFSAGFWLLKLFTILSLISLILSLIYFRLIGNKQYYILIFFSLIIINIYFLYWGILF
ncbi:alpha/beta fold hydrolase [Salegentibacter sp. UBA1130]|uniref:alpha/beta fold hydrolase n=1 Tax=Salegentibacter sp. UBA1130 TaxID=1947451 RepID=UPI00257D426A|nr:alpha/beta fold hydrolase [Salegentibacter sp. UBA1130]